MTFPRMTFFVAASLAAVIDGHIASLVALSCYAKERLVITFTSVGNAGLKGPK